MANIQLKDCPAVAPERALEMLKSLNEDNEDSEVVRACADTVICSVLRHYGHEDLIEQFKLIPRYTA